MPRRLLIPTSLAGLLTATPARAQGVQEIPNAMSAHTLFIIVITGAFLVWAASFSLQTMKDRADRNKERRILLAERERILDEIARIETGRDSGDLAPDRYERRLKKLRGDLARVVEKLGSLPPVRKKHA